MGRKPRVDRSPEENWQIVQEGIKSRSERRSALIKRLTEPTC
jgi:hypothetical protein